MSDSTVELGSQEVEQAEAIADEQLSELGNNETEDSTQESVEEAVEQVSIDDLMGETKPKMMSSTKRTICMLRIE